MNSLIVEDDPISSRFLEEVLEKHGTVTAAANGKAAVQAFLQARASGKPFDLICLDIMMPGMGGQEALAAIRQLELEHGLQVGQGARVIMTTALEDHTNVRQAFKASADGYVVKPIEKQKLFRLLGDLGLQSPVAG